MDGHEIVYGIITTGVSHKFDKLMPSVGMLFIPIAFSIFMMTIIRFWMAQHRGKRREIPQYSLDAMRERPPKHIQRMARGGEGMPIGLCHTYGINVSHSTLNLDNIGLRSTTPPVARSTSAYKPAQPLYSSGSLTSRSQQLHDPRSKFI
ncbi:hypothetical protein CAPTEDRAFT_217897 [Capitella teleta]|uniref:Uncharacterized protein n=1 Tax=Capitella teleta TaxID=283909 RepID=R7VAB6_CAPTE|nr:hypothetical protein CAPTEDRAFT_217897 [Capitella teleta]|eukprot:ELU13271.1 hypothetical protein CAPTEDRAFT_217897 [Capitella teleta]